MKVKKKKTMIELLREIRDKISLDIMDMTFEEQEEYFRKRKDEFEQKQAKKKYKTIRHTPIAAEPKPKYGK